MAPGWTVGSRQAGGWNVILSAVVCLETLGPRIKLDVNLTCVTYLNIAVHQIHPLLATMPSFRKSICPTTLNRSKVLTPQISVQSSIYERGLDDSSDFAYACSRYCCQCLGDIQRSQRSFRIYALVCPDCFDEIQRTSNVLSMCSQYLVHHQPPTVVFQRFISEIRVRILSPVFITTQTNTRS